MTDLRDLQDLYRLREILNERQGLDTNGLERDFLAFASCAGRQSLTVHPPRLYAPEGDEAAHLREALAWLGHAGEMPAAIDISGAFDRSPLDGMVLLSGRQLDADHIGPSRSYLNPLLERIYADISTLTEFTVHEALVSRIACRRGELELREASIFPDRFSPGRYTLEVSLDTPSGTIRRLQGVHSLLEKMAREPCTTLLDPTKAEGAVDEALSLRSRLGALSRYTLPKEQRFSVETDSCVFDTADTDLFYLYAPATATNILVHFGEQPFKQRKPGCLTILDGGQHEYTLAELVRLGVYAPSIPVLTRRIKTLQQLQDGMARASGGAASGMSELQKLIGNLEKANEYMRGVVNEDMRREYVSRLSPELLEFMVCPASQDPVIHDLLPRLSWNAAVRRYSDTDRFMREFGEAGEERRAEMLKEAMANLSFTNQQNVSVNNWLYRNHQDFCSKSGITFDVW